MPPCIDVYALIPQRDRTVVNQFLARYGLGDGRWSERAMWDGDIAPSADEALKLALSDSSLPTRLYLRSGDARLYGLVIGFATEGFMTLGVQVDDPFNEDDRARFAKEMLAELAQLLPAESVGAAWNWPPPDTRTDFESDRAIEL